ncbi:hypothetical protein [Phreatobacter oligotrophus]|jgi:hypothetical protein|uniref:hypothetical protein n=1 Tax=Phreatobacter oligotrophus TaxID=1122261 RepID=UPI003B599FDB|nr:hypothetical protein [Phreatobacter oligotrophus]
MLIHGARAALPTLSQGETPLGGWLRSLLVRSHVYTVVVALAAKLARIACAVLHSGKPFETKATRVSYLRDQSNALTRRARLTRSAGGGGEMACQSTDAMEPWSKKWRTTP